MPSSPSRPQPDEPTSQPETPPAPAPAPSLPRRMSVSLPGFLAPSTRPDLTPIAPLERTEDPSLEPPAADSAPGWSGGPLDDELPAEDRPKRKSGASPASSLASRAAFEEAGRKVVLILTELAYQSGTAGDPLAQDLGLWLADEQDVDGIAEPAAAIVSRRSPAVGNDLVDGIALAIAVAGYVSKQLGKLRELRRIRRAGLDTQLDPQGAPE